MLAENESSYPERILSHIDISFEGDVEDSTDSPCSYTNILLLFSNDDLKVEAQHFNQSQKITQHVFIRAPPIFLS